MGLAPGPLLPKLRPKLLQFRENYRPAYWGTWRKRSRLVTGRRPLGKDPAYLDYDVDSDEDWEEEEPGESISHSEVGARLLILSVNIFFP